MILTRKILLSHNTALHYMPRDLNQITLLEVSEWERPWPESHHWCAKRYSMVWLCEELKPRFTKGA